MTDSIFVPIDIPTLALVRGLMQLMLAGLLVYIAAGQEHGRGARLWAAGFMLNGTSLFLFSIRTEGAWQSAIAIGNHLTLGGRARAFCSVSGRSAVSGRGPGWRC